MSHPDPVKSHTAFMEAARMLKDASGGGSVLMLEWAVLQRLADEAAQLYDDLPVWHAPPVDVQEKRRWWQRSAVRAVRQMYLLGYVQESIDDSDTERVVLELKIFLLGEDGVLRLRWDSVWFARDYVPLAAGWMGVDDPRWTHVSDLGAGAESAPIMPTDVGVADAEHLLQAFERLATLTRDRIASRLGRLRAHL